MININEVKVLKEKVSKEIVNLLVERQLKQTINGDDLEKIKKIIYNYEKLNDEEKKEASDYLNSFSNALIEYANFYKEMINSNTNIMYDKISQIISALNKNNSLYSASEVSETISRFNLLNNEEIINNGYELLKDNSIKFIVSLNKMNDTKTRAILINLFNSIYDTNTENKDLKTTKCSTLKELLIAINQGIDINAFNGENPIIFSLVDDMLENGEVDEELLNILNRYKYDYDLEDKEGNNLIMHIVKKANSN